MIFYNIYFFNSNCRVFQDPCSTYIPVPLQSQTSFAHVPPFSQLIVQTEAGSGKGNGSSSSEIKSVNE